MQFVESPTFTRELTALLSDEAYQAIQITLMLRPEAGSLIPGGRGLRKLRWGAPGRGKRGGLRLIYHWEKHRDCIYMLYVYRKSRVDDLTREQIRRLRILLDEYLK